MTIQLNISGTDANDVLVQLKALAAQLVPGAPVAPFAVAQTIVAPGDSVTIANQSTTPVAVTTRKPRKAAEQTPTPAADTASGSTGSDAMPGAGGTPPSNEAAKAASLDEQRARIKALLVPKLSDPDKAPEVAKLVLEHGKAERLSKVLDADIPALLAAAEKLA